MTNMSTNATMSTITNTKTPPPASNCPFYRSPTLYPFHLHQINWKYLKFEISGRFWRRGLYTYHRGGKMHDKAGENTMFWHIPLTHLWSCRLITIIAMSRINKLLCYSNYIVYPIAQKEDKMWSIFRSHSKPAAFHCKMSSWWDAQKS